MLSLILLQSFILYGCSNFTNVNNINQGSTGKVNNNTILSYLDKNLISPSFGGKVFSSYKILGSSSEEIYVWVLVQEFYKANDSVKLGTAISAPVVLVINQNKDSVTIVSHKIPGDGAQYSEDVKKLFPKEIQEEIFNIQQGQTIEELSNQIKERARKRFQE